MMNVKFNPVDTDVSNRGFLASTWKRNQCWKITGFKRMKSEIIKQKGKAIPVNRRWTPIGL
jgi:hypothetical protein